MEHYVNGHRFENDYKWEHKLDQPYDYAKHGLIKHLLSHKIIESKNKILQNLLQYYEKTFVFLMKYVDILKNFKNPHWKNR